MSGKPLEEELFPRGSEKIGRPPTSALATSKPAHHPTQPYICVHDSLRLIRLNRSKDLGSFRYSLVHFRGGGCRICIEQIGRLVVFHRALASRSNQSTVLNGDLRTPYHILDGGGLNSCN